VCRRSLFDVGQCTLAELGLWHGSVPISVLRSQTVGDAVVLLDSHQVSAVAVVNERGKLMGTFSLTNLLDVWLLDSHSIAAVLLLSVEQYLSTHSPSLYHETLFNC
jgi:predicted transcriptional regulator